MTEDLELQDSTKTAEVANQETEMAQEQEAEMKEQVSSSQETQEQGHSSERDELYALTKRVERALKKFEQPKPVKRVSTGVSEEYLEEMLTLKDAGFSTEEIKQIRTYATAQKVSLAEASKNPFVLGGIKALREQVKAQAATPAPSSRARTVKEKSFTEMSPSERAKEYSFDAWKEKKSRSK